MTGNLQRGTCWTFDFVGVPHLGEEVVRGLLGVAVTSPDVILQPVRSLVRLLADGAGGAGPVHAVLVPDVSGEVLLQHHHVAVGASLVEGTQELFVVNLLE